MSDKKTRESWEVDETHYFLRLINEKKVVKSLDGKRFRADEIFVQLVPKMEELGYRKTARQLQTKFRTLREKYNKVLKAINTSGEDTVLQRKFVFFEEMHALLSERPVQNLQLQEQSGVDSTDTPDSENTVDSENSETTDIIEQETLLEDTPDTNNESDTSAMNITSSPRSTPSTSGSRTTSTPRQKLKYRPKKRTFQETIDGFAETSKNNCFEVQSQLLSRQETFIKECFEKQYEYEKEMLKEMMATQKAILQETTASLVAGMQNMYQRPAFYGQPSSSSVHGYHPYTMPQPGMQQGPPLTLFQSSPVQTGIDAAPKANDDTQE